MKESINALINGILKQENHLSYSSISAFKKSPLDFIKYKYNKSEPTPAMEFGSMVHKLLLEQNSFFDKYILIPENAPKKPTNVQINAKKPSDDTLNAIEFWDQFISISNNKIIINSSDYHDAEKVIETLYKNQSSFELINSATSFEKEHNFVYDNFLFKAFIDAECDVFRFDLKVVANAEPRKFQRDAIAFGYPIQSAVYEIASGKKDFYNIAVDKTGGVSVHKMTRQTIDYGRRCFDEILENFNRCILEDAWLKSYEFYSNNLYFDFDLPKYLNE
jgi:exodeoxyribonuclease VIII